MRSGAAYEGMQSRLTSEQVCHYLLDKYDHPERLAAMSAKIRRLATPDAAAKVAELVEERQTRLSAALPAEGVPGTI